MKEFYKNIVIATCLDEISYLLKNVHITINKALIQDIFKLEMCEIQIFPHKTHPTLKGYDQLKYDVESRERILETSLNIVKIN